MTSRIGRTPAPPVARPGAGVIRPRYGIFIRDNVAKFRTQIAATLADTNKAIAGGKPGKEVLGDGVLQGTELTRAKAAAKDLEKALKYLETALKDLGPVR